MLPTLAATLFRMAVVSATAVAQDQDRDQDRIQLQDKTGDQVPDRDRDRAHLMDPDQDQDRLHDRDRLSIHEDDVYGGNLMSEQERRAYDAKMSSLGTQSERDRFKAEHRAQMQERAKKLGVTIPGNPDPERMEEQMRLRPTSPSMPAPSGMPGGGGGGRGR
jgi:hypothetical protein